MRLLILMLSISDVFAFIPYLAFAISFLHLCQSLIVTAACVQEISESSAGMSTNSSPIGMLNSAKHDCLLITSMG